MFSSFFSKKENDLIGKDFKNKFLQDKDAVLLDVRTASEYASGTISGAKNIDFLSADFQENVQKLDPAKTYFLFCRSGNRSGSAASLLEKKGIKSFNLIGGVNSWPV